MVRNLSEFVSAEKCNQRIANNEKLVRDKSHKVIKANENHFNMTNKNKVVIDQFTQMKNEAYMKKYYDRDSIVKNQSEEQLILANIKKEGSMLRKLS